MTKLIAATILACLLLAAPAMASVSGAERAVEREVLYDYGKDNDVSASCTKHGRNYYTCKIEFQDLSQECILYNGHFCQRINGSARIHQYGKRYSGNYRLYW